MDRGRLLAALMVALLGWGCEDEEKGASCENDSACDRGQICDNGSCRALDCNGLQDCPGSGRTCLFDLRTCSIKECNDANGRTCGGDRPICVEDGAFRNSCIGDRIECATPADCAPLGAGYACCSGQCSLNCSDMAVIDIGEDAGLTPDVGPDAGEPGDAGVDPDGGGPPPSGQLCAPCNNADDCAELGEGAECTPLGGEQVCSSACDSSSDCPPGFSCVDGLGQCLPVSFQCEGCLREPCAEGQICNYANGECVEPRGECGPCTGDADCADGLTCGPLGDQQHCFAACDNGGCPAGQMCADGLCKPDTGVCDACAGRCMGDTPACIEAEGRCAECGPGVTCPEGLSCTAGTFVCEEGGAGCVVDADCVAPTPVCFGGECVACLVDEECPPRMACTAEQRCIPDNCRGVTCQAENACDDDTGRCMPGCQNDMDCGSDDLRCNGATGQCYYTDGTCDLDAAVGVCAPGGRCEPGLAGLIHGMTRGNCICTPNPDPNQTGCQPGTICNDGSMFMLPSSCGINIFMPPP